MQEHKKNILLHLSLIPNIGPATVLKIFCHLLHDAQSELLHIGFMDVLHHQDLIDLSVIYRYTPYDFVKKIGCSEAIALQLVQGLADQTVFEKELRLQEMHAVKIVTVFDADYPENLKQIHTPPLVLYYQGDSFLSASKRIGIVGSRKASTYAHHVIKDLVPELVTQGWSIVSGGALGADTMAHEETLAARGKTIAVLGSGLLQAYPESNKPLFKRIVQAGGLLVSPFPLLAPPEKGNFPARNRIIAGLSMGCVVVQAAEKSGALITARYALEQGRQIFAVPGLIHDPLSAGCHALIKQGATLVNRAADIFEEFGEVNAGDEKTIQPAVRAGLTSFLFPEMQEPKHLPAQKIMPVLKNESESHPILQYLHEPATIDELLEHTGIDFMELQNQLFTLQLAGMVRQNFIGTWQRI